MPAPKPEFVECLERYVVALARDFTMDTRGDIPALWHELWNRPFEVEGAVEGAAYGVSFGQTPEGGFRYGVGFESTAPDALPDGACTITLAAGQYAVFRKRASVTELPPTMDAIFNEWLPASGYQLAEGAVFERYPDDPEATPDAMLFKIWVPVQAG